METGRYSILEILEFQNLEQLIIPEIQRDYVWSELEVRDILESIEDGFKNNDIPYLGFLYAYNDKDYVYKYFLIDGQQRLTTLFLLLVAIYYNIGRSFPEHIIKNWRLKLDYKVRQATHDFMYDFIKYLNANKNKSLDSVDIRSQNWYHIHYNEDITISNLINNFTVINNWVVSFDKENLKSLLEFVEETIQVSYFKIENGRQGEELYIYMNSRGRHLVENETLKAKFLSKILIIEDKEKWGRRWEEWQDFFWVNRLNNPDSDRGFDDFLRIVQILTMSIGKHSVSEINQFIISNDNIDFEILPCIEDVDRYFIAYKYMIENEMIQDFYGKYESADNYLIKSDKKQIDYFRILPIIKFVSSIASINELSLFRFNRFFYNISRKSTISKDIRNHLIGAIKLMHEYGLECSNDYDVCDLLNYTKGRTVLLDEEEIIKLNIYKSPPAESDRENIEAEFWKAEDHDIFSGNISFLLLNCIEDTKFDFDNFRKSWKVFQMLFEKKSNYKYICKALIYYGNTWKKDTPYYYNNYDCQDWSWLVMDEKGRHLMRLIKDMYDQDFVYIKDITRKKISIYFKRHDFANIEKLKVTTDFFSQMRILVAIDFYGNDEIWNYGGYISEDDRYIWKDDVKFFYRGHSIFNVKRYIYGGYEGRVFSFMKKALADTKKLAEILNNINF